MMMQTIRYRQLRSATHWLRLAVALILSVTLITAAPAVSPGIAPAASAAACDAATLQKLTADGKALAAEIAAHNALLPTVTGRDPATVGAYNADAAVLNTRRAATIAAIDACIAAGVNGVKPTPPPTASSNVVAPPPGTAQGAPGPHNGFPTPQQRTDALIKTDIVSDDAGQRIMTWTDGGVLRLSPLQGRASMMIRAERVTPNMLASKDTVGSAPNPNIYPPGWDPTKTWPTNGPLQRGHLFPKQAGGTGLDARNLITITNEANAKMIEFENRMVQAVINGKAVTDYTVMPSYGNGFDQAPTMIMMWMFVDGEYVAAPFITNIP